MLEELVETVAAKVGNIERSLERLEETGATREQVQLVYQKVQSTHRLLLEHVSNTAAEFKASRLRDEAIMQMLGDLIGRLPSSTSSSPTSSQIPLPLEDQSSTSSTSSSESSTAPASPKGRTTT